MEGVVALAFQVISVLPDRLLAFLESVAHDLYAHHLLFIEDDTVRYILALLCSSRDSFDAPCRCCPNVNDTSGDAALA